MAQAVSVTDVMSSDYLGVTEGEPVSDVVDLLLDHREDTALVIRGGQPVGIVLARDLLAVLDGGDLDDPIERYMHAPVSTVDAAATISHAADRLLTVDPERLVVVDLEGTALGIIRPADVLTAADTLLETQLEGTFATSGTRSPPTISEQGVCESCGRLADTLTEVDGSLLCSACVEL